MAVRGLRGGAKLTLLRRFRHRHAEKHAFFTNRPRSRPHPGAFQKAAFYSLICRLSLPNMPSFASRKAQVERRHIGSTLITKQLAKGKNQEGKTSPANMADGPDRPGKRPRHIALISRIYNMQRRYFTQAWYKGTSNKSTVIVLNIMSLLHFVIPGRDPASRKNPFAN